MANGLVSQDSSPAKRAMVHFILANDKFGVDGREIKIPKLGWVKMTEPLRFDGKIMSATVSYKAGYWFASIHVEMPAPERHAPARVIGVDLGVKSLAVDSDGVVFENQKHLAKAQRKTAAIESMVGTKAEGKQEPRESNPCPRAASLSDCQPTK